MKCSKCGYENSDKAKFCTRCGNSLMKTNGISTPSGSNKGKYTIIGLIIIIILLVAVIGYIVLDGSTDSEVKAPENVKNSTMSDKSAEKTETPQTTTVSSQVTTTTEVVDDKEWLSIGSYSGSGTGCETISVPQGKIMVKLSAFPIKNYATNHLYVTGSNGQSGSVDWGPKSAVETRSDSFTYTSKSEEIFTIDYYETVSWQVEFFIYQ